MRNAIVARRVQAVCLLIWNLWIGYSVSMVGIGGGERLPAPLNAFAAGCWITYFLMVVFTLPPASPGFSPADYYPGWHWITVRHARLIVRICLGLTLVITTILTVCVQVYGPVGNGWWVVVGILGGTLPLTVAPRAVHPLDRPTDDPVPF